MSPRLHDALVRFGCAALVALLTVVACSDPVPSEAEGESADTSGGGETPSADDAENAEAVDESEPRASQRDEAAEPEGTPTVFTRISFDLRGMPHRGPYDVDQGLIDSRLRLLMERARDAAGEPAPRILASGGASVFRVELYGPEGEARAQCERVVAEVAPPPPPGATPRHRVSAPSAEPCQAIVTSPSAPGVMDEAAERAEPATTSETPSNFTRGRGRCRTHDECAPDHCHFARVTSCVSERRAPDCSRGGYPLPHGSVGYACACYENRCGILRDRTPPSDDTDLRGLLE